MTWCPRGAATGQCMSRWKLRVAVLQVASALEQELGAHALLIPFGQVTDVLMLCLRTEELVVLSAAGLAPVQATATCTSSVVLHDLSAQSGVLLSHAAPAAQASDACHLANERISRDNLLAGKNVIKHLLSDSLLHQVDQRDAAQ